MGYFLDLDELIQRTSQTLDIDNEARVYWKVGQNRFILTDVIKDHDGMPNTDLVKHVIMWECRSDGFKNPASGQFQI